MTRTVTILATFLFVGLMASPSVQPAEAGWASTIQKGPNAGYCANALPGQPTDFIHAKDLRACPENRRNGTVRQKTQQGTPVKKPKSTPNLAARQANGVLPTAPTNKVTLRGERVRVGFSYHVNADCSSAGEIKSRVLEQPKNGVLEMVTEKGFTNYPKNDQKYKCNETQSDVKAYYYKSREDFKGKDRFVVEVFYSTGNYRERLFNIDVR
jgi:hypothetical protein